MLCALGRHALHYLVARGPGPDDRGGSHRGTHVRIEEIIGNGAPDGQGTIRPGHGRPVVRSGGYFPPVTNFCVRDTGAPHGPT